MSSLLRPLAWHFVNEKLRDGRPVPADDDWMRHEDDVQICRSGLHASVKLRDAMKYAPGDTLCRVTCQRVNKADSDKFVCRDRKIIWRMDVKDLLSDFARQCARDVLFLWSHSYDVSRYLTYGESKYQAAAEADAGDRRCKLTGAGFHAAQAACYAAMIKNTSPRCYPTAALAHEAMHHAAKAKAIYKADDDAKLERARQQAYAAHHERARQQAYAAHHERARQQAYAAVVALEDRRKDLTAGYMDEYEQKALLLIEEARAKQVRDAVKIAEAFKTAFSLIQPVKEIAA